MIAAVAAVIFIPLHLFRLHITCPVYAILGMLAVIFGAVSLCKTKANRSLAIVGIVLGIFANLILVIRFIIRM